MPAPHPAFRHARLAAGLRGVLATALGLGVGELLAAAVRPESSPLIAVGDAVVVATPESVKDWAIRTFHSQDKLVLIATMILVITLFAALVGVLARSRRRSAGIAALGFGALGVAAALSAAAARRWDWVPSAGAGIVTAVLLLTRSAGPAEPGRRGVLAGAGVAALAALAGLGGRELQSARFSVAKSRAAVRLPPPDLPPPTPAAPRRPDRAPTFPDAPGLSPYLTANADFYRVDTALAVPQLSADGWMLRVHGMVRNPMTLTFAQLRARPLIERTITLSCVSNEVGGMFVGTAKFLGLPLRSLLREAGVLPGADQLRTTSVDGWTCGTPTAVALDGRDSMLAIGMNGVPLPIKHGFPVRMVVPGLYGYASGTKWIVDMELTTFAAYDSYWVQRGWGQQGLIKTESRIDRPGISTLLAAGPVPVAGVAWAQHRGITRVEVRVNSGPWHRARIAPVDTIDAWRQWVWIWNATPGAHTLQVRATDATGYTQTEEMATPFPDGATGYHTVPVTVQAK